MLRRPGRLLLLAVISFHLLACGGGDSGSGYAGSGPAPKTSPTTLTGNWFLAGQRVPVVYPVLSTSLFVQGSSVYGEAAFAAECLSNGVPSTIDVGDVALTGIVAADGSFTASSATGGSAALGTFSLSLAGTSPPASAPSTWSGSYSLAFTPGTEGISCAIVQTSRYTAVAIAPVTGSYTGVPTGPFPNPFGAAATVTLQLTQGQQVLETRGSTASYVIPLTANLVVKNSTCDFSALTTGALEPSTLAGDRLHLAFVVANTAGGGLEGTLDSYTSESFSGDLTSLARAAGCPAGVALYEFRRSGS